MPSTRSAWSGGFALAVAAASIGCGGTRPPAPRAAPAPSQVPDRLIVRSGDVELSVDSVEATAREVERLVTELGGFVERASINPHTRASVTCRLPATQLEQTMDRIASLGDEKRRSVSASDVTEQYTDLEARLRNSIALRERLQQLLERAQNVAEALAIEKELARVQAEVEMLQARLDRMRSQVELATLTVTIGRKRVLGPLSYVGYGLWWVVSKLFVIRWATQRGPDLHMATLTGGGVSRWPPFALVSG